MNKIQLLYSYKNIPIPSRFEYKRQVIEKTEDLVKRMRYKAWHFLNTGQFDSKQTFGFRTTKQPPPIPELKEFETEVFNIITKIEFSNVTSTFQEKLKQDVEKIKNCPEVIVKADKTSNLYKIPPY